MSACSIAKAGARYYIMWTALSSNHPLGASLNCVALPDQLGVFALSDSRAGSIQAGRDLPVVSISKKLSGLMGLDDQSP